jgi:phospholipase A1
MMSTTAARAVALLAGLLPLAGLAQNPDPIDIRGCTGIESDAARLACYDKVTGRVNMEAGQKRPADPTSSRGVFARGDLPPPNAGNPEVAQPLSLLDSRWELSPESKLGTFNLRGYQPIYVMPLFATSHQNDMPRSPNPLNSVNAPQALDNTETKFQLSLKTKVWQGVFGDAGDLWVDYTQSSRWQLYNVANSRPFRETNYEPEALLVFDTHYNVLGWDGSLFGIGVNHQSNGRADPLSRSWNRVIANIGFERPGWVVMLRPWWRIPEDRKDDNNPDISNYVGRGEAQIVREWRGQEFSLTLRHSFRGGSDSRGSGRLTWSFPVAGKLRGYAELFKGYGESLIDYNHNATYLGLGVALLDWY